MSPITNRSAARLPAGQPADAGADAGQDNPNSLASGRAAFFKDIRAKEVATTVTVA